MKYKDLIKNEEFQLPTSIIDAETAREDEPNLAVHDDRYYFTHTTFLVRTVCGRSSHELTNMKGRKYLVQVAEALF